MTRKLLDHRDGWQAVGHYPQFDELLQAVLNPDAVVAKAADASP